MEARVNPLLLTAMLVALVSTACLAGASVARKAGREGRITAGKAGSMDRDAIYRMLSRVEKMEEPELVMGAMCYEPVAMPAVAEYLCPVCGEKTVYDTSDDAFYTITGLFETRALFAVLDSVSTLDMALDESSLCSACRSDSTTEPALVLRVTWDDGRTHSSPVTAEDLRMLTGFMSGRLDYVSVNDGTFPLRQNLDRIREILGMDPEGGAPCSDGGCGASCPGGGCR